jgi:nucleoside phosphorylase
LSSNVAGVSRQIREQCGHWYSILERAVSHSPSPLGSPLRSLAISTLASPTQMTGALIDLCKTCTSVDVTIWLLLPKPAAVLSKLDGDMRAGILAKINEHIATEIKALRRIDCGTPDGLSEILDTEMVIQALASVQPADAAKAGVNVFRSMPFLSDETCRRWLIDLFTKTHYTKLTANAAREIASVLLERDYPLAAQVVRETAEEYFRDDVVPIYHEIRYKYQLAKKHRQVLPYKPLRLPRVIIATALPLERNELIKMLGATHYDAQLFADVATWPTDDPLFQIYVITTGAGNLEAQGAILHALRQLKPKLAFFVGVAGGVKDSNVGDVIYSTKVYYYEGGKEEDDGMKSRPVSERTSKDLVQLALRVAGESWQPGQPEGVELPKATPAVIASGESVLASNKPSATTFQHIKRSYNDTQVVDMEGYGFLKACADGNLRHSMVIRGVSDKIEDKAESDAKGNQPRAAQNAAAFLFALLRSYAAALRVKKKKRKKILGIF